MAAARGLGRAGTAAAIPVLLEVEANGHPEARRAARQAIAAIQNRLPGAGAGQLSLASAGSGALSVVDDTLGRVSLSEQGSAGSPPLTRGKT